MLLTANARPRHWCRLGSGIVWGIQARVNSNYMWLASLRCSDILIYPFVAQTFWLPMEWFLLWSRSGFLATRWRGNKEHLHTPWDLARAGALTGWPQRPFSMCEIFGPSFINWLFGGCKAGQMGTNPTLVCCFLRWLFEMPQTALLRWELIMVYLKLHVL